jgi:hypothetical protein
MPMFHRSAVPLVAVSVLAACLGCRPAAVPPGSPAGAAPNGTPQTWSPEQQKAVDLARDFLAKNKTDWGAPSAAVRQPAGGAEWVGKPEDTFMITYPMPQKEEMVGGPRAVFVNIQTGKAMFVPRD